MRKVLFAVTMVGLLNASGCKKVEDLSMFKTKAEQLVQNWQPKLKILTGKLDELKTRAAALPEGAPGFESIKSAIAGHETEVKSLLAKLEDFRPQFETALNEKKVDTMTKVVADTDSELSTTFTKLSASLEQTSKNVADAEAKAKEVTAPAVEGFAKTLSSGFELKGATVAGIESQLVGFIDDAGKKVDKDTWFNFDRLTFKTGAAELDREKSQEQINNMAEILKAYPNLKLKVGGYTDNTGDAAANKKLSQERAQTVVNLLVASGVDKSRLEAEGYGAEHPVCAANDTDECKEQNRRIAVRVTAK